VQVTVNRNECVYDTREGTVEAVRTLLNNGASTKNKSKNEWKPIHLACGATQNALPIVELLLQHDPSNLNEIHEPTGWTPFLIAVSKDNTELAMKFIGLGVDIHQKSTWYL
jgi:ankyrin repeat protein